MYRTPIYSLYILYIPFIYPYIPLYRTQSQWGIPADLQSPLGWQSAIFELQSIDHNLNPSAQLNALTRTAKAIYNEFKMVIMPGLNKAGKFEVCIGADDLVPIFMFVFCRSRLRHPIRYKELMWALCHPDQLQGEAGYYLTVFESCIEFLSSESMTASSFELVEATNRLSMNMNNNRASSSSSAMSG